MYIKKRGFSTALLAVLIIFVVNGWTEQAHAQKKYPTRAIDIICPFSPGGGSDSTQRIIAAYLNKKWNVPVNVINKPGGNTVPACLEVYNSPPNGYTVLADGTSSSEMLGVAVKNLPFKVMDRTFLGILSFQPHVISTPSTSPFKSLRDLAAEAKKDPGNFTWTSLGGASSNDYVGRQFFKAIGVDIKRTKPVICRGGSEAASLTAGGHVKMGILALASGLPTIKGKLVRALALTGSPKRWHDLPDVPTTQEIKYPTVTGGSWHGNSGPPKLPSYIVKMWDKALGEMIKDPEVLSRMKNIGGVPFYRNSNSTVKYIAREIEEIEKLWGLK